MIGYYTFAKMADAHNMHTATYLRHAVFIIPYLLSSNSTLKLVLAFMGILERKRVGVHLLSVQQNEVRETWTRCR